MALPIKPPFPPMEAQLVAAIPEDGGWQYEPKWDGFRCLAFRDGDKVELQSKAGQPLARYFPEIVAAVKALKPQRFVLDGEIVVPVDGVLSFDDLLMRIHPAESRIRKLSAEHPALYIVFDLLVDDRGAALIEHPLAERRKKLDAFAAKHLRPGAQVRLSPATDDLRAAKKWFASAGRNLDGVIAKRCDADYRGGDRTGMVKVKNMRTAECVVAGFRYGSKDTKTLGSLLLGLYDDESKLQHVGVVGAFTASRRAELVDELEPLMHEGEGHPWHQWAEAEAHQQQRLPGNVSRWNATKDLSFVPLRPERVLEVKYEHMEGTRFRHLAHFVRWRDDRTPESCTYEQLEQPVTFKLDDIVPGLGA